MSYEAKRGWILGSNTEVSQSRSQLGVVWTSMTELGEHTLVGLIEGVPRLIVYLLDASPRRPPMWVAYVEGQKGRCECRTCEDAKRMAERVAERMRV